MKDNKLLIIKIDGSEEERVPANGKKFTLTELQESVGGMIQYVPCVKPEKPYRYVLCDEEGVMNGKEFNVKASQIFDQSLYGDIALVVSMAS